LFLGAFGNFYFPVWHFWSDSNSKTEALERCVVPFISFGGVRLNPFVTSAIIWPIVLARMMSGDGCGAAGGMFGRGSRSTRRKPAPVLLFPPQIPHDVTRTGTRAAAVGSRPITNWALARQMSDVSFGIIFPLSHFLSLILL
jgi:hypothetical protein